jgi:methyl-accepting chemotaxis protein
MNWSSLLPSSWNPREAYSHLSGGDPHGFRDLVIIASCVFAGIFAVVVLWQTVTSWFRVQKYLRHLRGDEQALNAVQNVNLPCFREMRHHLIDFPSRDGSGKMSKRRTVDATDVFRETILAPAFCSNRFILAIPSILTGFGVFGTFVGLQLGIGGLKFDELEKSIRPLIEGCAVAFSSSIWGVGASLIFSGWEKLWEGVAFWRVHKLQNRIDSLFPRYVPEEAMSELERTSRETEYHLKHLAVAIGAEMQQAIGRLGAEIKDAVSNATAEGHGPLMQQSAEMLSSALTAELGKLKEQIGSMSEQFSERFNGASDGLMKSVQSFQPAVQALSAVVGDAQRAVVDAVGKLNAHEAVMKEMVEAAANIRQAAEAFGSMKDTLSSSATRNEDAARAQLSAAQANERVAEQFGKIGEGLPEIRQTLEDAARVIGSLGSPIAELQALLAGQPELQRQMDNARSASESERSQMILAMSGNLAEKVGLAAQQFSEVGALADKLTASAESLSEASEKLSTFGQQVVQASKDQREASEASRAAALSGERTAKAYEPLPNAITALTDGLATAGESVRTGAESARDSYRELIVLQKMWFDGAELGLNGMKDRLQSLIKAYGEQVDGQTRNLMKQWTDEVAECLKSYDAQVSGLQDGLEDLQDTLSKLRK